jgi:3'-5' exoribonuclease
VAEQRERRIGELKSGDTVEQLFMVQSKDLRRTASGSMYVACQLADRTGTIDARWWQATEAAFESMPGHGFIRVKGRAQSHRGVLQLHIESLEAVADGDAALADFWPASSRDPDEMWAELRSLLSSVENAHLRRLVDAFLDDSDLVARFSRVPAGTTMHHSVVGGALEHTVNVVRLAAAVAVVYGDALNRDLLLVGAFLHDIGKAEELTTDSGFRYTDRGNLVGHIAVAAAWVQRKAEDVARATGVAVPSLVVDLVQHMILSHHGTRDRGSPKPPMIPEALVLHAIDDLDTRLEMMRAAIAQDRDPAASFTAYHKALDVKVFKKSKELPE